MAAGVLGISDVKVECPFNYEPCTCNDYGNGYFVTCLDVPVDRVQSVLVKTPIEEHYRLYLNFQSHPCHLPAGFSANTKFATLSIHCSRPLVQIDYDAFQSSRNYTESVILSGTKLTDMDFNFLSEFLALRSLSLSGEMTSLESLPWLPNLEEIVVECAQFSRWYLPARTPNVNKISIRSIAASGETVIDNLLNSITAHNESLTFLELEDVGLKRFPEQIKSLTWLKMLNFFADDLTALRAHSVHVTANLTLLSLRASSLKEVEPQAFHGKI